MKIKLLITGLLLFMCSHLVAQQNDYTVVAKIIESDTSEPLEGVLVAFVSKEKKIRTQEFTNKEGLFSIEVPKNTYKIYIKFLGFDKYEIEKIINKNIDLGIIKLNPSTELLEALVIETEQPDVEYKLDKKVYNIAENNIVKGGTASDVLENIPSLEVDSEGNLNLRGNSSVRVFINGKNWGQTSSIANVLKMIPADTIEKVEVITNPSSRYSAEGGAGIVNIKLKKGANKGTNGSVSLSLTNPWGYNINTSINHKVKSANFYTQLGYRNTQSLGDYKNYSEYFDENKNLTNSINEQSDYTKQKKGYFTRFGADWDVSEKLSWSNSFTFNSFNGENPSDLTYDYYNNIGDLIFSKIRNIENKEKRKRLGYDTDLTYVFDKDTEHKLVLSGSISNNTDNELSQINIYQNQLLNDSDRTFSDQENTSKQINTDYVLPLSNGNRIEAGYQGDFNTVNSSFEIKSLENDVYATKQLFLSDLVYNEQINALYTQFAGKQSDRFNYMLGLRWEHSKIDINQKSTDYKVSKVYNQFFPSVFLNYEISESNFLSLNYSRRIWRPRGRMINPVSNYSSSINFFTGNPDLNPAFTNSFELGYLKKWRFSNFQAQMYFRDTENSVEYVKRPFGINSEGIPITVIGPVNVTNKYQLGTEFNMFFMPKVWWRIYANLNLFKAMNRGEFVYTDHNNKSISQNFDSDAYSLSVRLSNTMTLPFRLQWQSSLFYKAAERSAQGISKPMMFFSTSLSKDVLNKNGTITLSVLDLFNTGKMIRETQLPQLNSNIEMQWRKRMTTLSFSYRFNQSKRDAKKNKYKKRSSDDEVPMMM